MQFRVEALRVLGGGGVLSSPQSLGLGRLGPVIGDFGVDLQRP